MKINLRNSRLIRNIAIVYFALLIFLFYEVIGGLKQKNPEYSILFFIMEGLYIYMLIYLISILLFFKEKTAVVSSFTMHTCLQGFIFINYLLPGFINSYLESLSILSIIINIYMLVHAFTIKSPVIASPFKLFGFSILVIMLGKFILTLVFSIGDAIIYINIVMPLIPFSILLLLKKVNAFIKENNEQVVTV